jgi:hypothetical protein
MMAAGRWGELDADSRELAALRYGIMDRPNRSVAPFRVPLIHLDEADSHVYGGGYREETCRKNLGRVLSDGGQSGGVFVSRVYYADGKPRSVGDFGHLSDPYDRISTKNQTLEGFSASPGQGSVEWRDPGTHSSRLHVRHSSGSLWRPGYEFEQPGGASVVD